ncbi:low molecular weight protein-tyrosine-phosphatase [Aliidiomarina haloalkalitolerans]|uniref:protein-tyrosine-phosphatase n=1 Tax=Aliidiomarina haloalkalitolerans TaxID=859059 RepID=A0A432VQY3_9GAMM|nr:low molecular weight protein-tyrosine-phosphatase [Aliidiomarina haloalkalitolerans]RUO18680.1 protein tyrosine phosphatase [Aliidiomarina haloalkalitolerans]
MFNKILVVCIGNICRSPTAEFLLKRELPHKDVASAGLYAMQGHDMNDQARTIAEANGVPCPEHTARQFTSELAKQYDLILVMEKRHRDDIAKRFPEALAKTMLLGHWDGGKDIPDPYKKSDEVFKQIFKMLETSALSWSKKLV